MAALAPTKPAISGHSQLLPLRTPSISLVFYPVRSRLRSITVSARLAEISPVEKRSGLPDLEITSKKAKPTVLVSEKLGEGGLELLRQFSNVDCAYNLSPEELCAKISLCDALIVRSGTKVTREVFEAAKGRLKVVGRAGVGIDNVDLQAATEHGCLVVNAPTANTIAAAEHGIALLTAMARNVAQADASMKSGDSSVFLCFSFFFSSLSGSVLDLIVKWINYLIWAVCLAMDGWDFADLVFELMLGWCCWNGRRFYWLLTRRQAAVGCNICHLHCSVLLFFLFFFKKNPIFTGGGCLFRFFLSLIITNLACLWCGTVMSISMLRFT